MAIVEQRLVAHESQILDLRLGNEHQIGLIVVGKAEGKPIDTRSDLFLLGAISRSELTTAHALAGKGELKVGTATGSCERCSGEHLEFRGIAA